MNIMQNAILILITIETLNILMVYFYPEMKTGNALGVSMHGIRKSRP